MKHLISIIKYIIKVVNILLILSFLLYDVNGNIRNSKRLLRLHSATLITAGIILLSIYGYNIIIILFIKRFHNIIIILFIFIYLY
jgi:hypothetical protein